MTIYTIGYEGLNIEDFIKLLSKNKIETIVDIRELPLSRKPGFSKKSLSSLLHENNYKYVHLPVFGCPKPIREQYRQDKSWDNYKKSFKKYIKGEAESLLELGTLASESNCALMCFEADSDLCHRSLVAKALDDLIPTSIVHIEVKKLN